MPYFKQHLFLRVFVYSSKEKKTTKYALFKLHTLGSRLSQNI